MDWNRIVASRLISFHHPTNNNNNMNHLSPVDRWFCRHHDKGALTRNELRPLGWPLLWHCQVPCAGRTKKTLLDLCTSFYGRFVIGGVLWLLLSLVPSELGNALIWKGLVLFIIINFHFLFPPFSFFFNNCWAFDDDDDCGWSAIRQSWICDFWWFCHEKWYSVKTVNTLYS